MRAKARSRSQFLRMTASCSTILLYSTIHGCVYARKHVNGWSSSIHLDTEWVWVANKPPPPQLETLYKYIIWCVPVLRVFACKVCTHMSAYVLSRWGDNIPFVMTVGLSTRLASSHRVSERVSWRKVCSSSSGRQISHESVYAYVHTIYTSETYETYSVWITLIISYIS